MNITPFGLYDSDIQRNKRRPSKLGLKNFLEQTFATPFDANLPDFF
jgi:hypothetical protein